MVAKCFGQTNMCLISSEKPVENAW